MKKNGTCPYTIGLTIMDITPSQSGYDKLEAFLDDVDRIRDPGSLEEPFRTLWLRVHGLDMSSMRNVTAPSGGPVQDLMPATVEIAPSKGLDPSTIERAGTIKRIEVLSPSEVGPTVEMKVEERKIKFRMADSKEVRSSNLKRDAGNLMVGLQAKLVPLTGLGGEVPSLQEKMKLVATSYKEADYERVFSIIKELDDKLSSEEFKKDILIRVQRRMSDYQSLGADTTRMKEQFRSLAVSLKEGKVDFYPLVSTMVKELEESIKGLSIEEVAVEVIEVAEEVPEGPPAPEALEKPAEPARAGPPPAPAAASPLEPATEGTGAEGSKTPPAGGEELRPVVRFVKRKLTIIPEGPEAVREGGEPPMPGTTAPTSATETSPPPVETTQVGASKEESAPRPTPEEEEKAARQKEATEAFNRIQLVHKAATAMHKKGKDVGQIFDLLRYAEEARKKGELKSYIGVSKQLESMLLSMQSRK